MFVQGKKIIMKRRPNQTKKIDTKRRPKQNNQPLVNELSLMTLNSLVKIYNKNKRTIENFPSQKKPIFIIKWGPPASGKSSPPIKNKILEFGYDLNSYLHLNIDDLVESTSAFQKSSSNLMRNKIKNVMDKGAIEKFLNNANSESVAEFAKTYTNVRFTKNKNGKHLGHKMDNLLEQALQNKVNITFETTGAGRPGNNIGTGWPEWLWKYFPSIENYQVIIIFPVVDFETTWKRYKGRAANMYIAKRGVRFASTRNDLQENYKISYRNFLHAYEKNVMNGKVERIIVVENNGKNTNRTLETNIGKNTNETEIKNMINKYIQSSKRSNNNLE